ncbi:hypothetical protein HDU98_007778 [Podochytrium sp. JEL0797]|nr:hypothetical protein HDU98_007778 [Podochytrium sp. JEL0797]
MSTNTTSYNLLYIGSHLASAISVLGILLNLSLLAVTISNYDKLVRRSQSHIGSAVLVLCGSSIVSGSLIVALNELWVESAELGSESGAVTIITALTPILILCIAAGLLYKMVDESVQTHLQAQTVVQHVMVNGSGSNVISTTFWNSIKLFEAEVQAPPGFQVDLGYESSNSGEGVADLFSGGVMFAGSEVEVTSVEFQSGYVNPMSPRHSGAIMLPVTVGALAVVYNLPGLGIGGEVLNFDAGALAGIFSGQIAWWNDTRLQSRNPGIVFPKELITVIVSSDASDTFPAYLARYSALFAGSVPGKLYPWPSWFLRGSTVLENMYISGITFNSITYTGCEAVIQAFSSGRSPTVANLVNVKGELVSPVLSAIMVAVGAVSEGLNSSAVLHDFLSFTDVNVTGAYPLTFASFVVMRQNYFQYGGGSVVDCLAVKYLVEWLQFTLTDSGVAQSLTASGWSGVGSALVNRNLNALVAVTCNNVSVRLEIDSDAEKNAFYETANYEWDSAIPFWSNLNSFPYTTIGMASYLAFYILLIASTAIPFVLNMCRIDPENDIRHQRKSALLSKEKIKWTLQNWLGIVTQCFTCFQIVYLCMNRSSVIQHNIYVDVVSYIGLIFDWFWYYVLVSVLVFLWLVGMFHTTYLYGMIEFYYPDVLPSLMKFHALLADFMPNFALIAFNPSVELLARVFDCRLSPQTFVYQNSYQVVCWQGGHWVMVVLSIGLGCAFTNCVVRYCKILKLIRKEFSFKDKDWNIYLESISKTVVIILYFNTPNAYFLPCAFVMMACLSACSLFGRPNHVAWFDRIRGFMYAYCGVVCGVLFGFELGVPKAAYYRRSAISAWLSPVILGCSLVVCFLAHNYAMAQFQKGVSDKEMRMQEEALKKFFAAFGDEIEMSSHAELFQISEENAKDLHVEHLTHDQARVPVPRSSSLSRTQKLIPGRYIPSGSDGDGAVHSSHSLAHAGVTLNLVFTEVQWKKLEEFMTKAAGIGLLDRDELEAVRAGIRAEDPMIPILFARSKKNIRIFTELLKFKVCNILSGYGVLPDVHISRASEAGLSVATSGGRRLQAKSRPMTGFDFTGFDMKQSIHTLSNVMEVERVKSSHALDGVEQGLLKERTSIVTFTPKQANGRSSSSKRSFSVTHSGIAAFLSSPMRPASTAFEGGGVAAPLAAPRRSSSVPKTEITPEIVVTRYSFAPSFKYTEPSDSKSLEMDGSKRGGDSEGVDCPVIDTLKNEEVDRVHVTHITVEPIPELFVATDPPVHSPTSPSPHPPVGARRAPSPRPKIAKVRSPDASGGVSPGRIGRSETSRDSE